MQASPQPDARRAADIRTLKEFHALDARRRELDDELVSIRAKMQDLEPLVLNYFQRHGIDRIAIDGITLGVRCDVYAGRHPNAAPEDAIEAVRAAGLPEYAVETLAVQKLTAYIRELRREGKPLPPEFEGKIRVSEVWKISCRSTG